MKSKKDNIKLTDSEVKEEVEKVKNSKKKKRKSKKNSLKKEKNKVKKRKKLKKRRLKKLNVFMCLLTLIFIVVAIIGALIGTGVIDLKKETGPILYSLSKKVKIGDYVNYDVGLWEEDKEVPNINTPFTFGGYKKDFSRNDGVTCNYNENENKGWRVFNIKDDVVTLIQSGISMCYYHGYGNATNDVTMRLLNNLDETLKYDYFLDDKFGESVRVLSKEDIDNYIGEDASYKRIRDNLINIDNPYWLATKNGSYYMWYVTEGGSVAVDHVGSYGVRILVALKKDVKTTGQDKNSIWILKEDVKKDE